ncbi:DegV family protein [Nesterenkonia halotolerans]|uniref:DegV family protein with EDD domain n=1 Tax=Nesterenkonia halotolerans TaxID=225325 RepID=A0ABR9J4I1_9MICC|nr:DegV family protein [Nesterenkonia halotolerans]MBE1513747.1 DegV family protein with EDD domain [Nesterenkonia halotolerans]
MTARPPERCQQSLARWRSAVEADLLRRRAAMPGRKPNLRRKKGRIAVVTDSSCSLPVDRHTQEVLLGQMGANIVAVPIPVMIGGQMYPETSAELDRDLPLALAQGAEVRTSRPSPGRLLESYQKLKDQGYAGVVSIHLSGELSGTVDAARLAAGQLDFPVTVLDSAQAGLALGHSVIDAAMTAQLGGTLSAVAESATRTARASESLFVLPQLDQLRRGGRINAMATLIGGLLWVKPLLQLVDGEIHPVERPRTMVRALERLQVRVTEKAHSMQAPRLAVHGFGNDLQALQLAEALQPLSATPIPVVDLPPALAAHLGLGALAVSLSPTP